MGIKRIRPAAMCSRPDCEGGGYLLSHFRSTIGVAGFNFSVRNGKRWNPRAVTTLVFSLFPVVAISQATGVVEEADFLEADTRSTQSKPRTVHCDRPAAAWPAEPLH